MLEDATPVCFVATANGKKSREFYEGMLGLKCISDDDIAVVFELNQTVLRVQKVPGYVAQEQTVHGWRVSDIERQINELNSKGLSFERFPCFEHDELGIWETPVARIAWFRDPDGNLLSFSELKQE